jgi:AraC-like DNA-binding protein
MVSFEYAVPDEPVPLPNFAIRAVYHVNADRKYVVLAGNPDHVGFVAVRTVRGRGRMAMRRGTSFELSSNTLLIVRYDSIARYLATDDVWEFWWFDFDVTEPLPIRSDSVYTVIESADERAGCMRCLRELRSPFLAHRIGGGAEFALLFARWLMSVRGESQGEDPVLTRLEPAISYIHEHFGDHVHIEDLAGMCALSKRRFSELFRDHTGSSPAAYLSDVRLNAARGILLQTNLSLKEVAHHTGFSDEYYLSRRFKLRYGVPPVKYRTGARPDPQGEPGVTIDSGGRTSPPSGPGSRGSQTRARSAGSDDRRTV